MAEKKSDKEKRETRRLAKARYRARKTEKGLKQISIWIPTSLFEEARKAGEINVIIFGDYEKRTSTALSKSENGEWRLE